MDVLLLKTEDVNYDNGIRYARVALICDNTSITLPKDGSEVQGMNDDTLFAPGSTIFSIDGHIVFRGTQDWGEWI